MAILVKVISVLFNYKSNKACQSDLSALARIGSGSACRSVFGGFSEWVAKLPIENGYKSVAVSIADETHWNEFNVSLLVVSHKKKDKGSTDGMKLSKETSEFLKVYLFVSKLIKITFSKILFIMIENLLKK